MIYINYPIRPPLANTSAQSGSGIMKNIELKKSKNEKDEMWF